MHNLGDDLYPPCLISACFGHIPAERFSNQRDRGLLGCQKIAPYLNYVMLWSCGGSDKGKKTFEFIPLFVKFLQTCQWYTMPVWCNKDRWNGFGTEAPGTYTMSTCHLLRVFCHLPSSLLDWQHTYIGILYLYTKHKDTQYFNTNIMPICI